MLENVSATTIAGRELGAMSTEMKSNLVASLDKSLNTSKCQQGTLDEILSLRLTLCVIFCGDPM
jgi:hypothetical protein